MSAMQNIMLAPEEDDDPYSGYDYNSIAAVCQYNFTFLNHCINFSLLQELEEDPEFHRIVRTGYAQRPPIPVQQAGAQLLTRVSTESMLYVKYRFTVQLCLPEVEISYQGQLG